MIRAGVGQVNENARSHQDREVLLGMNAIQFLLTVRTLPGHKSPRPVVFTHTGAYHGPVRWEALLHRPLTACQSTRKIPDIVTEMAAETAAHHRERNTVTSEPSEPIMDA